MTQPFFNTAGPVNPELHYCLPPLQRLDLDDVLLLIEQQKYFVLHAPRQTGKTSALLALMHYLNTRTKYRCVYVNVEVGQAARENALDAMRAIFSELAIGAQIELNDTFVAERWPDALAAQGPHGAFGELLSAWSAADAKPLIQLIDEIDTLIGDTLISVLRQLRAGYNRRPRHFPQSVVLCGVRDVRDYRIHSSREKTVITGGSAFNIKAKSLRMGDFDQSEAQALYHQHTEETGQVFEPEALERVWELTQGQPWLLNALGYKACFEMKSGRDCSKAITAASNRLQLF